MKPRKHTPLYKKGTKQNRNSPMETTLAYLFQHLRRMCLRGETCPCFLVKIACESVSINKNKQSPLYDLLKRSQSKLYLRTI